MTVLLHHFDRLLHPVSRAKFLLCRLVPGAESCCAALVEVAKLVLRSPISSRVGGHSPVPNTGRPWRGGQAVERRGACGGAPRRSAGGRPRKFGAPGSRRRTYACAAPRVPYSRCAGAPRGLRRAGKWRHHARLTHEGIADSTAAGSLGRLVDSPLAAQVKDLVFRSRLSTRA